MQNVLHRSETVIEPCTEKESFFIYILSDVCACVRVSERESDDVYMTHKQVYVQ